jgi:site-specific recombinase XerD
MSWSDAYTRVWAPAGFDGIQVRKAHYFKTKNAAREFQARIKRWKVDQKTPATTLEISEKDKRWVAYLRAHVGNLDQLPEIVAHWERTAKQIKQPLSVEELAKQFVAYRQTRPLERSTLADDRYVANRFIELLGKAKAHEVTPVQLRSFLETASTESTARKFYKIVSLMFDFAREHRIIVINPLDEIDRPSVRYIAPGILTPAEFKQLLLAAEATFPALFPFLVIAGFAGIRREELLREYANDQVLAWSDFKWDKRVIEIRSEVAKRTSRKTGDRRFVPVEEALIDWLSPYRKETGSVIEISDSAFRRQFKRLCESVDHKPLRNSLRHSFASYALARTSKEGLGRLALQMGNSESVIRRHYLEVLSQEDGEAWFGIRRD